MCSALFTFEHNSQIVAAELLFSGYLVETYLTNFKHWLPVCFPVQGASYDF